MMKRLISILFLALAVTISCDKEEYPDMSISSAFIGEAPDHSLIVRYALDFDYPEWIKDIILEITNSPDEKLVYLDIFSGLGNSETLLGKTVYFIIYRDKPDKGIAYWEDGQIIDLSDPVRLTDFTENTIMWRKIFDIEHYIPLDRTFFTKGVSYEPQSDYPNWLQSRIDETDLPDFPYNGMSIFKGEWKQQTVYLVSYASGCNFCSLFDAAGNVINLSSDEEIRNFSAFSKNWICIFRFDVNYYFYTSDYYYAPYEPVDSLPEWVFPLIDKTPFHPAAIMKVFQCEWREQTVYMIHSPNSYSSVYNLVFFENGEHIVWESIGEMRLYVFLRDSKNWKKVYDSTLQDEMPEPITDS